MGDLLLRNPIYENFIGVLADNIPTGFEWVSVALVTFQYMTDPDKGVRRGGPQLRREGHS